jgi:hypothetical protein
MADFLLSSPFNSPDELRRRRVDAGPCGLTYIAASERAIGEMRSSNAALAGLHLDEDFRDLGEAVDQSDAARLQEWALQLEQRSEVEGE